MINIFSIEKLLQDEINVLHNVIFLTFNLIKMYKKCYD